MRVLSLSRRARLTFAIVALVAVSPVIGSSVAFADGAPDQR